MTPLPLTVGGRAEDVTRAIEWDDELCCSSCGRPWALHGINCPTLQARPADRTDARKLRVALQNLVDAEDCFVRETGVPLVDPVAEAVESARAILLEEGVPK
jgi:hypothetical protein